MYKIGIILGTRPEIIKMSPVIRELTTKKFFLIHTNQHYSENMDKIFFEELNLKKPDYNLNIGSGSHGDQTGRMLMEIEKVLLKEKPDFVLVQGHTNPPMFSTIPIIGISRVFAADTDFLASKTDTSSGVVTITTPSMSGIACSVVI